MNRNRDRDRYFRRDDYRRDYHKDYYRYDRRDRDDYRRNDYRRDDYKRDDYRRSDYRRSDYREEKREEKKEERREEKQRVERSSLFEKLLNKEPEKPIEKPVEKLIEKPVEEPMAEVMKIPKRTKQTEINFNLTANSSIRKSDRIDFGMSYQSPLEKRIVEKRYNKTTFRFISEVKFKKSGSWSEIETAKDQIEDLRLDINFSESGTLRIEIMNKLEDDKEIGKGNFEGMIEDNEMLDEPIKQDTKEKKFIKLSIIKGKKVEYITNNDFYEEANVFENKSEMLTKLFKMKEFMDYIVIRRKKYQDESDLMIDKPILSFKLNNFILRETYSIEFEKVKPIWDEYVKPVKGRLKKVLPEEGKNKKSFRLNTYKQDEEFKEGFEEKVEEIKREQLTNKVPNMIEPFGYSIYFDITEIGNSKILQVVIDVYKNEKTVKMIEELIKPNINDSISSITMNFKIKKNLEKTDQLIIEEKEPILDF